MLAEWRRLELVTGVHILAYYSLRGKDKNTDAAPAIMLAAAEKMTHGWYSF
jgi:hypothetical protein